MIIILTGTKAVGKSTALMEIATKLKEMKKDVAGIISKRLWINNERVGYNLINIKDGNEYALASDKDKNNEKDVMFFCSFAFNNETLRLGNRFIKNGLDSECLIVDEIGKMEMNGGGWSEHLREILKRDKPTILAVRSDILSEFVIKYKINDFEVFDLEEDEKSAVVNQVVNNLI